ncbi:MAG: hypothetical protein GY861_28335 [bacterium]|nr:hypothetical protein [bacterium]
MANLKFVNFFTSKIADVGGIGTGDLAVTLTAGSADAGGLPTPVDAEYFYIVLVDASANREICKVTSRSGDILTIVRGQDNTIARQFLQSDIVEVRFNAGSAEDMQTETAANTTAISALGTISSQDADSVNIDGGNIDGTAIGETTQSTAQFTSLIASTEPTADTMVGNRVYNDSRYVQSGSVGAPSLESGTHMLFYQAAAPTGWVTKVDWGSWTNIIVGNSWSNGGSDFPFSYTTAVSVSDHSSHDHDIGSHTHNVSSHSHTTSNHSHGYGTLQFQTGELDSSRHFRMYVANGSSAIVSQDTFGSWGGDNLARNAAASYEFWTKGGSGSTSDGGSGSTGDASPATGNPASGSTSYASAGSHSVSQSTWNPRYQVVVSGWKNF